MEDINIEYLSLNKILIDYNKYLKMVEEDFVLPQYWYIEITDDNRKIVNDWKIKQEYNNDLFENLQYRYVYYDGGG